MNELTGDDMAHRKFRCYMHGKGSGWEAICTDLDISVQGDSFEDAKSLLNEALVGFFEALEGDSEVDQKRFLKRKSPLWLRSLYYWRLVLFTRYDKQSSKKEYAREDFPFTSLSCEL